MPEHAVDYVRTRNPAGTLQRNVGMIEQVLRTREAEGYRLVSSVPDMHEGDLSGVLLLFVREIAPGL